MNIMYGAANAISSYGSSATSENIRYGVGKTPMKLDFES